MIPYQAPRRTHIHINGLEGCLRGSCKRLLLASPVLPPLIGSCSRCGFTASRPAGEAWCNSVAPAPYRLSRIIVRSHHNTNGNSDRFPNIEDEIEDPTLYDLFYGMGSSGHPAERPPTAPDRLTREEAAQLIGMGTWRLRKILCPPLQNLASNIEGRWRAVLPDLSACPIPEHYRYIDSVLVVRASNGKNSKDDEEKPLRGMDPPRDDPQWPRLRLENRAYSSHAFRKLHLEVAVRQDGLQVVHCVMYPRLNFDLPILSIDMVASDGRVTLCIIDPCPVTTNLTLPSHYLGPIHQLQDKYGVTTNRGVPAWGEAIFSQFCVCMRPTSAEELGSFLKYAVALSDFHLQMGRLAAPVGSSTSFSEESTRRRLAEIRACHERFASKQLENDKTRRVLESKLGSRLTEDYMTTVMFDVPAMS